MPTRPIIPPEQIGTRRRGNGGSPQKYVLDEPGRKLILALYDSTTERTEELMRRLNAPRWRICKWARDLGVSRQNDLRWAEKDEQYLRENLHKKSFEDMAKHLKRTIPAIRRKSLRLGLSKTYDPYTMQEIALGLGCDGKRIRRWVEMGWLKGSRRGTKRAANGDPWEFTEKQIRDFILAHPGEIDQRKFDWLWIVDILAGDRGLGRLDEDKYTERGRKNVSST
jgi:hypothetical protein